MIIAAQSLLQEYVASPTARADYIFTMKHPIGLFSRKNIIPHYGALYQRNADISSVSLRFACHGQHCCNVAATRERDERQWVTQLIVGCVVRGCYTPRLCLFSPRGCFIGVLACFTALPCVFGALFFRGSRACCVAMLYLHTN